MSDAGPLPPGQEAPDGGDALLGKTLADRYIIERKLGEGGMGAVYLARHATLDKLVALKVLHGEFKRKPDLVERFLQEARAASKIRHENVIDITDFGSTPDGLVFFAMELLEGVDLHEVLTRARLENRVVPWSRSRPIFLQMCAALAAAHARGIIHRDLKPENIYLVDWGGQRDFVKLLDFGIAKVSDVGGDGERKLTKTGMIFGTPEYMAPEQARGERPDHRVDVYAMGCILYQLVTGRVPFEAETFMGVLTKHMTDPVPPLGEALSQSGAPPAIEGIVTRALAKDREERFQNIEELAEAVGHCEDGDSIAQPTPRRSRTRWSGRVRLPSDDGEADLAVPQRARWPWVVLGLVVVAAGGASIALTISDSRGGPAQAVVADAAASAPEPEAKALTLDSEPQGARVFDVATGDSLGTTPLEVRPSASERPRQFRFELEGHRQVIFAVPPDASGRFAVPLELSSEGKAESPVRMETAAGRTVRRVEQPADTAATDGTHATTSPGGPSPRRPPGSKETPPSARPSSKEGEGTASAAEGPTEEPDEKPGDSAEPGDGTGDPGDEDIGEPSLKGLPEGLSRPGPG